MPKAKKEELSPEFGELPKIAKNEVIQETDFYKEMKKYEGKEESNIWPIIIIIVLITALLAGLAFIFLF